MSDSAIRAASAGPTGDTVRSDLHVAFEPGAEPLVIEVRSKVDYLYSDAIRRSVERVTDAFGLSTGRLVVTDAGALDFVILARVETCLRRAGLDGPPFLLVLDGVQDPHNLGACLRTADAAGVQAVIVPRDRAAGITPVVRKVACGAAETVPVFTVTNLARSLRVLKEAGVWIFGASDDADRTLYDTDLRGPLALVLGGEGKGLRRLTRELCDYLVAIPMAGRVESLNVSVAAGVLLFEARRQRGG